MPPLDEVNTAPAEVVDDLHGDIAAAFDAPVEPVVEASVAATETPAQAEQRTRDEQGRFAAKSDAPIDPKAAPVAQVAAQPDPNAPPAASAAEAAPPPGWSIAAKAAFKALPAEVRDAVVKREQEVNQGFQKLQGYKDIERVLEPHATKLAMRGMAPAQAIQTLFAAQDALDRDPVNGIRMLAQSYGVDLRQFGQGAPQNGQAGNQNPLEQFLSPLVEKITALEGHFTSQQQAAQEYQRSQVDAEVNAFRANPKNIYLADLEPQMAALIKNGQADNLQDAYDKASWLHPEIRQRLISEQQQAAQEKARTDAAAIAQGARRAAGSLTGAPVAGSASLSGAAPDTIEGALHAAWSEVGARV